VPHSRPTDGGSDMTCPTEIAISDRREGRAGKKRLHALITRRNADLRRIQRRAVPAESRRVRQSGCDDKANIRCPPAVSFAECRFEHYLMHVSDKIGSFKERERKQRWLQYRIMNYVGRDPLKLIEATRRSARSRPPW